MKFFPTALIRKLDQYTIEHEPITSIDLMERAANALYTEILINIEYKEPIHIFAGPGNNGGDALALARMLLQTNLNVKVILLHSGKLSADCETNRLRLLEKFPDTLTEQTGRFNAPDIQPNAIIIDGLFGSGLSRPLSGIFGEAVEWINKSGCPVYAIDIPSGLQGEENPDLSAPIIRADYTLSLQFPKLAFLLPENAPYIGNWQVIDIGIHPKAILETPTNLFYLEESDMLAIRKKRTKFSHKGTFGHAVIIAGSKGMAGASVLAAKAALRSGAGLVTVHGPKCNRVIVQSTIPEAMFVADKNKNSITVISDNEIKNTVAVGPGIGTHPVTEELLRYLLSKLNKPCVLDADALNIIAENKDLLEKIPTGSILTPHPKEFERLFGFSNSAYKRMLKAQEMAQKLGVIIVLKGAHTLVATPSGNLHFNSTGNPGMATAGSGDVLTGILAGLLVQGYSPEETAKLGVFIQGRAGDLALETESQESLNAGDIINRLGKAFQSISTFHA